MEAACSIKRLTKIKKNYREKIIINKVGQPTNNNKLLITVIIIVVTK